jgi:threonine synthase
MKIYKVECIRCGARFNKKEIVYTCRKCGGLLDIRYDKSAVNVDNITRGKERGEGVDESIWRYGELLPFDEKIKPISIREGNTPLYRCDRLAKSMGIEDANLYVKHEGLNPTGSFKDRGMTVGVTKAMELGVKGVACASTGNTSASLSAYAARAGIPCYVLLPQGKVALGKIAQTMMHGAKVFSLRGNFDAALDVVRTLCLQENLYLLNSVNPYRLEGQKTIAFEIAQYFGWRAPDRVVLPVGNAGNISAIFKGFSELNALGIIEFIPKMTGIQAEGAKPIVNALKEDKEEITPEDNPETIASAIRIGNPVNAPKALLAIRKSNGIAESVTDDEITEAQGELARLEGIGVEPASAASIAGLKKLIQLKEIEIGKNENIVCITTGHLLKDPERVIRVCEPPKEVEADVDAVREALRGE